MTNQYQHDYTPTHPQRPASVRRARQLAIEAWEEYQAMVDAVEVENCVAGVYETTPEQAARLDRLMAAAVQADKRYSSISAAADHLLAGREQYRAEYEAAKAELPAEDEGDYDLADRLAQTYPFNN